MCSKKILLSVNALNELFKVTYSVSDSSQRQLENRAITFWRDFLLDSEGTYLIGIEITLFLSIL